MKALISLLFLVSAHFVGAQDLHPQIVKVPYQHLYVPQGFDSNDSVQFAAEGMFPNACYKVAGADVAVDEEAKTIRLEGRAFFYQGLCATVIIPFQQVISVGIVRTPGLYKIIDGAGVVLGEINIAQASSALEDDYLYAPVQKIFVEEGNDPILNLRVEFTNSCMRLKEVKVEREPDVIVILPIAEYIPQPEGCKEGYFPILEKVVLDSLENKRYLIHVRTTGSQALNEILVN